MKRDRELQQRYNEWAVSIVQRYGSVGEYAQGRCNRYGRLKCIGPVDYLMNHRLRWGQPDTLSLLKSRLVHDSTTETHESFSHPDTPSPIVSVNPPYFSWETPSQFISIIENDWPYSGIYNSLKAVISISCAYTEQLVPTEIEHTLIWTKMPIYHPDLVAGTIKTRIDQDGLWGFTGNDLPPSPSNLPSCISKLAEWGITMDKMIKSEPPTEEEKNLIQEAGREVHRYVKNRWVEKDWETAWFVNPPVNVFSLFFLLLLLFFIV